MSPPKNNHKKSSSQTPSLEITGSRQFSSWLHEQKLSLAFTTYQAGKVFLIGLAPTGKLSIFERTFNRSMGLWAQGSTLYLSSLYQLWRFENALEPKQTHNGYDCLYVPQMSYTTGDLDIHDVVVTVSPEDGKEQVVFVNTLFSCLARVSETHSFIPVWKPPFISRLAPEDRCHLNGLAVRDGQPRYVSVVSQSDIAQGWRKEPRDRGCIMDIHSNEVILSGLSMPHSPRWYQNRLWLLNSGTGEFGYADLDQGKFEPVAFCPGYLRGLAFWENFAIVGVSKPRKNKAFSALPLEGKLQGKNLQPQCGLFIIDLRTGNLVHSLQVEGVVEELYDVVVLPGVRRPMAIGLKNNDEIRRMVTIGF